DEHLIPPSKQSWPPMEYTVAEAKELPREVDTCGNILEFTMWDEVAKHFNKQEIEKLTPPIIIAVNSYRVIKYRDVQLTTAPATYYYINPRTPEAEYAYTAFKEKYKLTPPLQTSKYPCEDQEQEKIRNRQAL
nr:nucleic acid-binding, OB-fold protein [Tanacetum cinerariifolium]